MNDLKMESGVWPVMLTPFTETGAIDRRGCEALIDWYLANRVTGIFAVCLSSEMFDLSAEERIELATLTVKRVAGAVPVVACAGFGDSREERLRSIREMASTGVEAVVLPLSVLFPEDFPEERIAGEIREILDALPDTRFGLYECPVPYKRLLSTALLGELAHKCGERLCFLKDTCCDREILRARSLAVAGTALKIYNANLTTLTESLRDGCAGFSGIAANFFPDALAELIVAVTADPAKADEMQTVFNTLERNVEFHYPRGAKEFLKQQGVPVSDFCRTSRPGFTAEEIRQIRDFGGFVELWKQSGYRISTQPGGPYEASFHTD